MLFNIGSVRLCGDLKEDSYSETLMKTLEEDNDTFKSINGLIKRR